MNNKQLNDWNNLRFGNQHPKYIRKHFTDYFFRPIKDLGFTFSDNKSDHNVILIEQKHNWYVYDKENNMAFMEFKYIKPISTFFVVNQEDYDFGVHIGWDTESQSPSFGVCNNYDTDDMFTNVWTDHTDDSKTIASAWASLLDEVILPLYIHRKRKTKWLSAIENDFYE